MLFLIKIIRFIDHMLAPDICPLCRNDLVEEGKDCCAKCASHLPRPANRCNICGGENSGYLETCPDCLAEETRPWFHGATAFKYENEIRNGIHRFKYNGQTYLARFFGRQMAETWERHHDLAEPEIIVPVPIHWTRRLERGYNQSELLCNEISKILEIPVVNCLKRNRGTGHQARKRSQMRRKNLLHAFTANENMIAGREILLVDDVFTTGSTLAECAKTLLKAGASDVSVLTIARD